MSDTQFEAPLNADNLVNATNKRANATGNSASTKNDPAGAGEKEWLAFWQRAARRSTLFHLQRTLEMYFVSFGIFFAAYALVTLIVWAIGGAVKNEGQISFYVGSATVVYAAITVAIGSRSQFRSFIFSGLSRRLYFFCALAADTLFCLATAALLGLACAAINRAPGVTVRFLIDIPQSWAQGHVSTRFIPSPFGVGLTPSQIAVGIAILFLVELVLAEILRLLATALVRLGRIGRWILMAGLLVGFGGLWAACISVPTIGSHVGDFFRALGGVTHSAGSNLVTLNAGTLCTSLAIAALVLWGIWGLLLHGQEEGPADLK